MEIVVYAYSGLGNQLFQYAAGYYYATKYRADLRIIKSPRRELSLGSPRPFQLQEFRISAPIGTATFVDQLLSARNPKITRASELISVFMNSRRFHEPHPASFHPVLPYKDLPATVYLRDYWQAAGYAEAVRDSLLEELTWKREPQVNDQHVLELIASSRCPVSVHVRRGDYHFSENPMLLPLSYYQRAWSTILEECEGAEFFVFSDDIQFARDNLPKEGKRTFVSHNNEVTAYQDLRIMASCRYHIIANSTFSWWGAWLSQAPTKVVIAPQYWNGTLSGYYPDMFPASWKLINNLDKQ
jgi:hypothetical protein